LIIVYVNISYPHFLTFVSFKISIMSLKKKWLAATVLFLILIFGFLLWPLGSSKFENEPFANLLKSKHEYLSSGSQKPSSNRPNILLITVDDLGMADCSLYGEGDIKTPNIDKLGAEGVVFENAYVTSPVCAPSRASMITGRYQHRFGFEFTMHERYLSNQMEYLGFRYLIDSDPWVPKWTDESPSQKAIDEQGLPVSEITLAEALKKAGYHTGIVGKWHLGWGREKLPSEFGFEEQYGFFNSHSLYVPESTDGYVDQKIDADWTDSFIWSTQRNGPHAIYRNNVEIEENEYLTDRITKETIKFIESKREKPFFLWTSYNAPHTPLQAPEKYVEQFKHIKDPVKRVYRAMIASLDDNLGELMEYLRESGLDENTLVFFISDNGGAEYTFTTDNGRYEGGKNTEFEGGVKVPMILRWKGVIGEGIRFEPMVSSMDIFTTALTAADAKLPARPLDGRNLVPFIMDSKMGMPHEYLFWQRGNSKAVRSNEWKLLINDYSGDTLLYNLANNRFENPNLARQNPAVVLQLSKAISAWQQNHVEPLWPSVIYFTAIKDGKEYYFEQ